MNDVTPTLDETLGILGPPPKRRGCNWRSSAKGNCRSRTSRTFSDSRSSRISRHLKLLVEAGLAERHREGAWGVLQAHRSGCAARLLRPMLDALDRADQQLLDDRTRLGAVRAQRAQMAQSFFARLAPEWDRVRSLHVPEKPSKPRYWRPLA